MAFAPSWRAAGTGGRVTATGEERGVEPGGQPARYVRQRQIGLDLVSFFCFRLIPKGYEGYRFRKIQLFCHLVALLVRRAFFRFEWGRAKETASLRPPHEQAALPRHA